MIILNETTEARLRRGLPESLDENDCWVWHGSVRPNGYGQFRYSTEQNGYPHIAAYTVWVEQIPDGLQIDHLCENKLCCNPRHLEAVTPLTNVLRIGGAVAQNYLKTHCKRGHEFTAENTYRNKRGGRVCRKCMTYLQARWRGEDVVPAPPD